MMHFSIVSPLFTEKINNNVKTDLIAFFWGNFDNSYNVKTHDFVLLF